MEEDRQVPGKDRGAGKHHLPISTDGGTLPLQPPLRLGMPIPNLEVQMACDKTINFRWYRKPMATCYSILKRCDMPFATKRTTLVQRGVTMHRNTRRELHHQLIVPLT